MKTIKIFLSVLMSFFFIALFASHAEANNLYYNIKLPPGECQAVIYKDTQKPVLQTQGHEYHMALDNPAFDHDRVVYCLRPLTATAPIHVQVTGTGACFPAIINSLAVATFGLIVDTSSEHILFRKGPFAGTKACYTRHLKYTTEFYKYIDFTAEQHSRFAGLSLSRQPVLAPKDLSGALVFNTSVQASHVKQVYRGDSRLLPESGKITMSWQENQQNWYRERIPSMEKHINIDTVDIGLRDNKTTHLFQYMKDNHYLCKVYLYQVSQNGQKTVDNWGHAAINDADIHQGYKAIITYHPAQGGYGAYTSHSTRLEVQITCGNGTLPTAAFTGSIYYYNLSHFSDQ